MWREWTIKRLGESSVVLQRGPKSTRDEWCVEGSQTHVDHIAAKTEKQINNRRCVGRGEKAARREEHEREAKSPKTPWLKDVI